MFKTIWKWLNTVFCIERVVKYTIRVILPDGSLSHQIVTSAKQSTKNKVLFLKPGEKITIKLLDITDGAGFKTAPVDKPKFLVSNKKMLKVILGTDAISATFVPLVEGTSVITVSVDNLVASYTLSVSEFN